MYTFFLINIQGQKRKLEGLISNLSFEDSNLTFNGPKAKSCMESPILKPFYRSGVLLKVILALCYLTVNKD